MKASPGDLKQFCWFCGGKMAYPADALGNISACPHCGSEVTMGRLLGAPLNSPPENPEPELSPLEKLRMNSSYKSFRRAAHILAKICAASALVNAFAITAMIAKVVGTESAIGNVSLAAVWIGILALGLSLSYGVREGGEMLADMADTIRNRR